ncbi:hypothetical protein [Vibrio salinus]|uniref:hypothetical protein n=1 Tax=Vibrio salinus TaxID=2899784 RepID=UPI001E4E8B2A|nr:hypothetical protein [Vibrio salinus]MCE0493873.1 hypothetical protein [Vibrio salinus]
MINLRIGLSALILSIVCSSTGWASEQTVKVHQTDGQQQSIPQVTPMRSMIMVSVRDDSDLPAAYRWLYKYHVPDSISQFMPYVTKYATYRALPLPRNAKNFGTYNWIMTEHYWLLNPFNTSHSATPNGLAFSEVYSKEYLKITCQPTDGELRPSKWVGSKDGYHPTVFVFLPVFWEDDIKGSKRTIEDGPNYRWVIAFKYPKGVSQEEGDKWFKNSFAKEFAKLPEVNRIISSRVLNTPRTSPFQRVAEIWFDNSKKWEKAISEVKGKINKPSWAEYGQFPYMEPYKDFVGEFLLDRPESDHLTQYRGYISTR